MQHFQCFVSYISDETELMMADARARGKLLAAAWRGEFDHVKASIESGEVKDVDIRDDDGVTALRFAAQYGHFEITQYLLSKVLIFFRE